MGGMKPLGPLFVWALLTAAPAVAETCPDAPDHTAGLEQLFDEIRKVDTEAEARLIGNRMWAYWADAPNEQAQAILDRGMSMRASWNLLGALREFNALVDYCPNYAEGYNQRAFVHYLRQDYAAALVDLDRALDLSPRHVAAISGRALSLLALDRVDEAAEDLQRALRLNPWLPERGLAGPGGPLEPKGRDI